jgi:hypothetical protein
MKDRGAILRANAAKPVCARRAALCDMSRKERTCRPCAGKSRQFRQVWMPARTEVRRITQKDEGDPSLGVPNIGQSGVISRLLVTPCYFYEVGFESIFVAADQSSDRRERLGRSAQYLLVLDH